MPIISCPHCQRSVLAKPDGSCPGCRRPLPSPEAQIRRRPTRRPASPTSGLTPPRIVAELDDSLPFLVIEDGLVGEGVQTIIDREHYEYLYGDTRKPIPKHDELEDLLHRMTRVRVIASAMFQGRAMGTELIIDNEHEQPLAELRETLRIVDDPRHFVHCACLGGPTLELWDGDEHLSSLGIHHGHSIRWNRWGADARLENGQLLTDWLLRYGFERELLDVFYQNSYDAGGLLPVGLPHLGSTPPTRPEQRMRMVELKRVRGGDLDELITECHSLLEEEPEMAYGYTVRAQIWGQQSRHDLCAQDCSEALRLGLREACVFYLRAAARDQLGHPEEALADCNAALTLDPNHFLALNTRGVVQMRLNNLDAAMDDICTAINLFPNRAWIAYLNRGILHSRRYDMEAAIADYDLVVEGLSDTRDKEDQRLVAGALWNRGECHRQIGNQEQAATDIREALRLDPGLKDNLDNSSGFS